MKRLSVPLFIMTALLMACGTSQIISSPVYDQKTFRVSLEHQDDNDRTVVQKYSHPCRINIDKLKTVMGKLVYMEEAELFGSKKETRVFQDEEITHLAPALVDAMAKANSDQRIRFASFNTGGGLLFNMKRKTGGVIFLEPGGRLNIAFNSINYERHLSEEEVIEDADDLSQVDPLKIKDSKTPLISILPYAELHTLENGSASPMWIVVNLDKQQKSLEAKPCAFKKQETEPLPKDTSLTREVELELEEPYNFNEKQETKPALKGPAITEEVEIMQEEKVQPEPWDDKKKDIKKKLEFLNELFDEGLINEKDYDAKKRDVLDKIK